MQEVKIEQIRFVNGISGCPGTSIDEDLMEEFKSSLDIENFKEILPLSLKELSSKLSCFEWGVELSFLNLRDDLSNNRYIQIFIKIYELHKHDFKKPILFYNSSEEYCEFKIDNKDLIEKGISLIFVDFFEFIRCMNTYVSVTMYRNFNEFENCCEELIKNKVLHFNFIDYINQEFDYKYKENLAAWNYINYLVGKDIRFANGQKIYIDAYDFKGILMCLVLFKCIPNQLDSEEVFSIFQDDDLQAIIYNLKLLCY